MWKHNTRKETRFVSVIESVYVCVSIWNVFQACSKDVSGVAEEAADAVDGHSAATLSPAHSIFIISIARLNFHSSLFRFFAQLCVCLCS